MKLQALMGPAVEALRGAGVDSPEADVRHLLAHAMNIPTARLTLHLNDPVTETVGAQFTLAMNARLARRPVSHITGQRLFWGRAFQVTEAVLDPRPETETLIAAALSRPFSRLLDLGTGSGCILLTLLAERAAARGLGTDLSPDALVVAEANSLALGLAPRAEFTRSDWFTAIDGMFDLIVSNPPYIAAHEIDDLAPEVRIHEPRMALTPGGDGLDAYRAIAAGVRAHLSPGGRLLVEIGPTQAAAVSTFFRAAGLSDITVLPDLDGRDRVVSAQAPASDCD